uniref:glycerate kinase type-2 family protein n=1 Tax=Stappia sp. TaxID=1870903 RepID=UPI003BA8BC72
MQHKDLLERLFTAAVDAARPETCLPARLPEPGETGRIILLAAGKAAGAMTAVAEQVYLDRFGLDPARLDGLCVTRHGYARPLLHLACVEAGHPVPDEAGMTASARTLELVAGAGADDHIVVLLSGGGSANWSLPVEGVTLSDKQTLTRTLLRSGATIDQINTLRRHLSRIKGGRLSAARGQGARLTTLAISDVPRDEPTAIASGPTLPDASTLADARALLKRFAPDAPASIVKALDDPANETPKPGDPVFEGTSFEIVARPALSLEAAATVAREAGYEPIMLGDSLEGEARDVAADHAARARELAKAGRRAVLLSGGELTVTIRGDGRGGPNQEYALALVLALDGHPGIRAVAGDTDGTDGGAGSADDPAGAFVLPATLARARALGHDAASFLARNDSTGFFAALDDLLRPGPTHTNVNDFRAVIIDKPEAGQP